MAVLKTFSQAMHAWLESLDWACGRPRKVYEWTDGPRVAVRCCVAENRSISALDSSARCTASSTAASRRWIWESGSLQPWKVAKEEATNELNSLNSKKVRWRITKPVMVHQLHHDVLRRRRWQMRLLETEGENELNNKFGVEIDFLYLRQRRTAVVQRRDRVRMFACGRENNKRLIVFVDWSSLRPTFTHLMVTLFFLVSPCSCCLVDICL